MQVFLSESLSAGCSSNAACDEVHEAFCADLWGADLNADLARSSTSQFIVSALRVPTRDEPESIALKRQRIKKCLRWVRKLYTEERM